MRVRSWMAALALIGASSILIGRGLSAQGTGNRRRSPDGRRGRRRSRAEKSAAASRAGGPRKPSRRPRSRRSVGVALPVIQIDLAVAGLGSEGCDVEIKPANASCKFRPIASKHIESDGKGTIELRNVELRGADKMCSIAITVREPGQQPQTFYRGFRPGSSKAGTIPSFRCYLSSRLAGVDSKTTRK